MSATGSPAASRPCERVRARATLLAGAPRLELTAMAVAAGVAAAWALWLPPVRDLAGQLFRVHQYDVVGLHVWNNLWYGGHPTPGYSALFPPVAAWLGIGATGAIAATATAGCFAALLHRHAGAAAWPGALWFAAATTTSLFTGRVAFALGAAFGAGACLAAQRGRPTLAALLGITTGATSAVAAAFVALAGVALAVGGGGARQRRHGVVLALAPALTVLAISSAFPVEGDAQFGPVTLAASIAGGLSVWAAAARTDRVVRAGALLYVAGCGLAFLIPTPLGGTVGRLAALVTGPLVITLLLARRRAGTLPTRLTRPLGLAALSIGLVLAVGWQWGAVRRDIHDAVAPAFAQSTREAFYTPVVEEIERRSPRATRVEIPFTATHYEALWVARRMSIARGWLRQLDRAYNPLFYDGRLTAARYGRWLRENGISWVALPAAPLDDSARQEVRVIRARPPYLQEVWRSRDWRLFRVRGSPGLLSGPGRLVHLSDDGLVLDAHRPGRQLIRVRYSRYWRVTSGEACVAPAGAGWTAVYVARPGRITITAQFGSVMRMGTQPRCRNGR
jgi:hypothetical protein